MGVSPTSTASKPNHRLQLSSVPWERVASRPPCKKRRRPTYGQISLFEQRSSWIGVGKALRLPSLRTARAVFPHTALRLEVSTSGLN